MSQPTLGYFNLGGTIRALQPEATLAWARNFYQQLGITRVANITGLDTIGIPVYVSIRPNAKHLSVSQGKGISIALAEASAVMETIEVYHVENAPPPAITGSFNQLNKDYNLINPAQIHHSFFADIDWQARPIAWAKGQELFSQQEIYLPHVLTTLDSSYQGAEKSMVLISSNGLASGNSLEEAICHGLYEVIERDSLFRWGSLPEIEREATRINLASIEVPIIQDLLKQYHNAGVLVKIWNITSEVGLPAFHTVIQERNLLRPLGRFNGTGAHISREVAVLRALTEAAQSRLTLISGSRDDVFPERYYTRITQDHSNIDDMLKVGSLNFVNCAEPKYSADFATNISEVLTMLAKAKFKQAIMFNHTRDDLKVPVVQVFVPGALYNQKSA